jgi:hypothetical protein
MNDVFCAVCSEMLQAGKVSGQNESVSGVSELVGERVGECVSELEDRCSSVLVSCCC